MCDPNEVVVSVGTVTDKEKSTPVGDSDLEHGTPNDYIPTRPVAKKIPKNDRPIHFEDALEMTKFGKFNYYLVIVCGVVLTCVVLETLGISYVIPVSECDMQLTTRDKGILSAIGFAGIISSSHLWGFLADTQGRRRVIVPTLFLSFTVSLVSSMTTNFWVFVVLRYMNGFFVAGSSATIYAYLGEFHTLKYRSRAIMGASVIFGITCVVLPLLAWLVINQTWELYIPVIDVMFKPWRLFMVVCGLPSLLCGLALIPMPESPKFVLSLGQQEETIAILRRMHRINVGRDAEPLVIASIIEEVESVERRERNEQDRSGRAVSLIKAMWSQTAPLFQSPNLKRTFIACTMQFGIYVSSNGMYMWFPEILNRVADYMDHNPGQEIGLCEILSATKTNLTAHNVTKECTTQLEISTYEHSIIVELLYAIGFAFIGIIINRIGKFAIIFTVMVGCGIAGIATVYVQWPVVAIYLYVILLCCGLAVPVVNAATVDLYPTNSRAMAICITLMMGRLGSVVGANIVGLLLDNFCHLAFTLSGSLLVLCGCIAIFIPNITQRVTTQSTVTMESRHSVISRN